MTISKTIITLAVWVLLIVGPNLPLTLMFESPRPWYMRYATVWFLLWAVIFSLAILLVDILGQPSDGAVYWLINTAYALLITWLIWKARPRRSRSN